MADSRQGKVTQELFNVVKILLDSGNSTAEIHRFMKLSAGTVSNIRNSETYEDYKALAYMQTKAYKAKQAEKAKEKAKEETQAPATPAPQVVEYRQNVTIQATHYMMQKLDETNNLLKIISNKLAVIVEDLYGEKKED